MAPELLEIAVLDGFELEKQSGDSEGEADDEGRFGRLELRLAWSDGAGNERRIDWDPSETPGLGAVGGLLATPAPSPGGRVRSSNSTPGSRARFDVHPWSGHERSRRARRTSRPVGGSVVPRRLDSGTDGLKTTTLRDHADAGEILGELRSNYVQRGTARPEVEAVLETDLFVAEDRVAVLATHPIRLRWVATAVSRWAGTAPPAGSRGRPRDQPGQPGALLRSPGRRVSPGPAACRRRRRQASSSRFASKTGTSSSLP